MQLTRENLESDVSFVTYTHSNCKDVWKPYFDSLNEFASGIQSFVFSNEESSEFGRHKFLKYDDDKDYCREFVKCLKQVKSKFVIYMQEDFILYDNVKMEKIIEYMKTLDESQTLSFVRLIKCGDVSEIRYKSDLFFIKRSVIHDSINSFSMQPTIWKKDDLISLYEAVDEKKFGENFSYTVAMNYLGIDGLYCYNCEKKRGGAHFDSSVFPYIATAVVRGKWNVSEYREELQKIFDKYSIDSRKRGHI